MKIYSNVLTLADVREAFKAARDVNGADIYIEDAREFKPRTHAHGVEVWAESMRGTRATGRNQDGYGRGTGPRAASWDDWGYVIARLFNADPSARVGWYDNRADFVGKVHQAAAGRKSDLAFLDLLTAPTSTATTATPSRVTYRDKPADAYDHDEVPGFCPVTWGDLKPTPAT